MRSRIPSVCQMCSGQCGIYVTVENGSVVDIEGIPDHPVTHGFICDKGRAARELPSDPYRLRYPLLRKGERGEGKWQRISWEEAIQQIAEAISSIKARYGPEAVAFHRGQASEWGTNWDFVIRFMNCLGSPTISTCNHLCHVPRLLAHTLTYGGLPSSDFDNARCIVLWGTNPAASRPYNFLRLSAAVERGAKLIVIDSRRTETASMADIFLQPRPGPDGALALAMLNVLIREGLYDRQFVDRWTVGFDELADLAMGYPPDRAEAVTWVPAELTVKAARLYATTKPACLRDGNGLDQHTNVVNNARAVAALRALTGNLDVRGGNVFLSGFPLRDLTLGYLTPERSRLLSRFPLMGRGRFATITPPALLQAIATGEPAPVRGLLVQGAALVESCSDSRAAAQCLRALDFLAVHDLYLTHTASLADIVLPASSFLERYLLYTYPPILIGEEEYRVVALQRPAVDPGECRSDQEFLFSLAKSLGLGDFFPWDGPLQALEDLLDGAPVRPRELIDSPYVMVPAGHRRYRKYEESGFNTPTGKVELSSSLLAAHGHEGPPVYHEPAEGPYSDPDTFREYPLIVNTGLRPASYTQTMFRTLPSLREQAPEPWVEIHPQTALSIGVEEGQTVEVESRRGKARSRIRITAGTLPGVTFMSYGWGQAYCPDGNELLNPNLLTDGSRFDPISGTTSNRSILGRIRTVVDRGAEGRI